MGACSKPAAAPVEHPLGFDMGFRMCPAARWDSRRQQPRNKHARASEPERNAHARANACDVGNGSPDNCSTWHSDMQIIPRKGSCRLSGVCQHPAITKFRYDTGIKKKAYLDVALKLLSRVIKRQPRRRHLLTGPVKVTHEMVCRAPPKGNSHTPMQPHRQGNTPEITAHATQ